MILLNRSIHTHPPSQTNCEVSKVRAGIKQRATETVMKNQQILAEQLGKISEGAAIKLPLLENLRRNIRSVRQERNLPALPINNAAVPVLPIEFQTTKRRDQFLFFDSDAGAADKTIAFASVQARQLLVQSEHWYRNDTFKVYP